MAFAGTLALACTALFVVGVAPASAMPPFPLQDSTNGTPGAQDPNWDVIRTNNSVGNTYTSDGWLRLTGNGTNQATNILNNTPFPSSTGFRVTFDYRQAGGTAFGGKTGDGLAFYLVDGGASVSAGAPGSGLGYARGATQCGVTDGYLGLGLDVFGNYASDAFGSFGGDAALSEPGSEVALRGSGPGDCSGAADTQYPWVAGEHVSNLWTGTPGDAADPATEADSKYRRVTLTVAPSGGSVQVSVAISNLAAKNANITSMTQVFSANLSSVGGQVALPATLKLGFSASTGAATDYHDIRIVQVAALTDAAVTKTLATPGHSGYPAGTFLPGDPISFTVTATNNGPTAIGDPPDGVARVYDDLSALPITGVSWTCAASGGATCDTGGGTGSVVSEDWHGPAGGKVTLAVSGTVTGTPGSYTNTALIPTNFTDNTVDPTSPTIQQDGGAVDVNLADNTASADFTVVVPHFTQTKSANHATYRVGDPISYTIIVRNDGDGDGTATIADTVPATVEVSSVGCVGIQASCTADNNGNVVSGTANVEPGGNANFLITGTVVAPGSAANTATVTPTTPNCTAACGGGNPGTPPIPTYTAGITLSKTATSGGQPITNLTVGQQVDYSFVVTNTGTGALTDVAVNEGTFTGTGTLSAVNCPTGTLAGGANETCTATYTVTQADIDAGGVTNTATASGQPPTGARVVSNESTVILPATRTAKLTIDKSATPPSVSSAGDQVSFDFTLTNDGNVTLTDVTPVEQSFSGSDPLGAISCPAGAASLAPTDSVTCTASYTVTQADMNAGTIVNTAGATADSPTGTVTADPSTATVAVVANPQLTIDKSATPQVAKAGDTIQYSFLLTNTGNITLAGVTPVEQSFSGTGALGAISCPAGAASLDPTDAVTCTASYTVTQTDVDAGAVTNTATATGTPVFGTLPPVLASVATTTIPADPALSVDKTVAPGTVTDAGTTVTYSYLVTNTGNVTMSGVAITETAFSGTGTPPAPTCPATTLAPTAQVTCTATYVVTQPDVDAGTVTNTAVASGTPPAGGQPVESVPDTAVLTLPAHPSLSVVKSASPTGARAGQTVTYSVVVTNTGNVTLTAVTVDDTGFTGTGTLSPLDCGTGLGSMAPDDQVTCTATYTLTQADIDAGHVDNSASATGTPPSGDPVDAPPSTVTLPQPRHPALTVTKTADVQTITKVGQQITYMFRLVNTGNVTLHDVSPVEDAFSGTGTLSTVSCPAAAASVIPGAAVDCTADYTVTQADLDAGTLRNTASATATPPPGAPALEPPTPSTVTIPSGAGVGQLDVVKRAHVSDRNGDGRTDPGDRITWGITVTNTGAITLTNLHVSDPSAGHVECPGTSLAPAASMSCTAPAHDITDADAVEGTLTNTAIATATGASGTAITATDTATVTVDQPPAPDLASTGTNSRGQLNIAWLLLVLGGLLVLTGRRRQRS